MPHGDGVDIEGRLDRQAFDEPGVVGVLQPVDEGEGQQQFAPEMMLEAGAVDLEVAAKDGVDLIEITLGDGDAGELVELIARR